jgi:hypothetical protein
MREYYIFVTESGIREGYLYDYCSVVEQVGPVFVVAVPPAVNPDDPAFLARYQRDRLLSGYRACACSDIAESLPAAMQVAGTLAAISAARAGVRL